MKNKNIKETINKLRKTIIELLKDGAEFVAYYLLKLLEVLLRVIVVSVVIGTISFLSIGINEVVNAFSDIKKAINSQIQEGPVLETKTNLSFSKNEKVLTLDKIIIDSNNNGIKDADDVEIKGKDVPFMEIKKGDTFLYLNQKGNNTEEYLPLAVIGNENKDVNIIKMPSSYYNGAVSKGTELDNKLANIIVSKVKEKAPRE